MAALGLVLCLFTPKILLIVPLMVTAGCAVISFMRREKARILALFILAGCAGLLALTSGGPGGAGAAANLNAAHIVDWNWSKGPTFGSHGTVKWNVLVQNTSTKPISMARVEFTTYDSAGKLLASTFTFVQAIPPGEARSADSYADLYGTEAKAETKLSSVDFSQ